MVSILNDVHATVSAVLDAQPIPGRIEFLRKWWNWQTHHLEGVAPTRRAGSSPAFRTSETV